MPLYVTFVSRRNRFLSSDGGTVANGYRISPTAFVSRLTSLPANWSLVTDKEARNLYRKSTYIISDNVFNNFTRPWLITDPDGADFAIENNIALSANSVMNPAYTYSGKYYRLNTVIRNNTLQTFSHLFSYKTTRSPRAPSQIREL